MNFTCWLHTTEIYKDAEVECSRVVDLPFAPSVGMFLALDTEDTTGGSVFRVDRVGFCVDSEVFWLNEDPDLERACECGCTPESPCSCCVFRGEPLFPNWTVQEVRRGDDRCWLDIPHIFPTGAVVPVDEEPLGA